MTAFVTLHMGTTVPPAGLLAEDWSAEETGGAVLFVLLIISGFGLP